MNFFFLIFLLKKWYGHGRTGRTASCGPDLTAAHPTDGHVTRLEHHRRGRHVILGAVVDQQVQMYLTKLLGVLSTVPLLWRLHLASRKPRGGGGGGQLHELGRYWGKSFMQHMGFVMRKDPKTAKKLSSHSEELKESYDIFDDGGEQHSS